MLGVVPSATPVDIRRAYLALARRHHPDAGGSGTDMLRLNAAYAVLSDTRRRRAFDLATGVATIGDERDGPGTFDLLDERPDDLLEDLLDDRPRHEPGRGHELLTMVPVAVFACSIVLGCVGLAIDVPAVVAVAFCTFVLSGGLMVAVPLLVMARGARR